MTYQTTDVICVQPSQDVAWKGGRPAQGLEHLPGDGVGPQFGASTGEQEQSPALVQTRKQQQWEKGEGLGVSPLEIFQYPQKGRDVGQAQDERDKSLLQPLAGLGWG